MASSKEYLLFVLDQFSGTDDVAVRPMMGEYILYFRGKIVGGIYDDRLLVKQTESAKKQMPDAPLVKPYEGGKDMLPVEQVDERGFLRDLFEAMFDELPYPKKKKRS